MKIVGTSPPMKGAGEKTTGNAEYTVDMKLPGMLYAKILRSPYAHANIRSIDTKRALAHPGVKAVVTHEECKLIYTVTHGSAREYGLDTRVRYSGDKVAAVAAVSEEIAEEALELIEVDYEVLPAVFDIKEAMNPDAPIVHPERDDCDGNILARARSVGNAVLKANIDGSFNLLLGVPDIGQGLKTVMAQIAAEALGGRLEEIDVTLSDTSVTPWGTTTAASRSTMETGGAVKMAAENIKRRILGLASRVMCLPVEELDARAYGAWTCLRWRSYWWSPWILTQSTV
jgi:CO/xanthine dehydrogenase Mo-binding subunit